MCNDGDKSKGKSVHFSENLSEHTSLIHYLSFLTYPFL